jgi:hypothetical protein
MADPRAFISFDFDHDETSKILFAGQGTSKSPTSFVIADWSSKSALPQAQWEAIVADKISRTNLLIVLVGRYMSTATGVAKEIAMAKARNVPAFGVYVDGAGTPSVLPAGLQRNRVVSWTWPNVAAGIDQCMTEGKNAR